MKSLFPKIFVAAVLLAIAGIYYSCKKSDLDLLPHGDTESSYFVRELDFTRAILGVYAKQTDYWWYHGDFAYGGVACNANMILLPGDDITTSDLNPFETFASISPSNGILADFMSVTYQMMARANVVIQKVDNVADGVFTTPGLKESIKGEALFLRGYGEYYLWTYFGTAPMDTVRVSDPSQFFPKSTTGTQLLDQAIADFAAAATLLPDSWDNNNKGRVTKNAAYAFEGKCLVFRGSATKNSADFAAALTPFSSISGASLVPNFDDNFAFDTENNSESLFEYQATQAFGLDNVWLPNDFDNAVGALSAYWGFYSGQNQYGQGKFVGTAKLAAAFEAGDPRKALTIDSVNDIQKYVTRDALDQVGVGSLNNPRILRLADVKLLQAEATLQSGGSTAAAIGFINEVRARARNMVAAGTVPADLSTAETDPTVIMQWIMDERLRELAGEGQRWPDVRRWALQGLITLDNNFFSPLVPANMSFQPKHLYFPIPTTLTDVNTNVTQNPGY